MTNKVCVFEYNHADALSRALSTRAPFVIEACDSASYTIPEDVDESLIVQVSVRNESAHKRLIAHEVCTLLKRIGLLEDANKTKEVEIALHEAISNAVVHGNLGIHSNFSSPSEQEEHYARIQDALQTKSAADKRIAVSVHQTNPDSITFVITDEGDGFDYSQAKPKKLGTPMREAERIARHGMGISLMHHMAKEVEYCGKGNSVRLTFDTASKESAQSDHREPASLSDPIITILVVDDYEFNRFSIRGILQGAGHDKIIEASNGKEALEQIEKHKPDIIITDLLMPVMDGYDLCKAIRNQPHMHHLPIIAITSLMDVGERVRAFDYGANDIILQPIHSAELMARINIHLQQARTYRELNEYKSRTQNDIELARQMHVSLIPSSSDIAAIKERYHLNVNNYFEPSTEIGGDLLGVLPIDDNRVGFYICDFTGHGIEAAVNTFRLHTIVSSFSGSKEDPGDFLIRLNLILCNLLSIQQFATFFYAVVDTNRQTLSYAGAGAPKPILYQHSLQKCEFIDSSGLPLGISRKQEYATCEIPFHQHDVLFLYSDALIESPLTETNHFLNEEQLLDIIQDFVSKDSAKAAHDITHYFLSKLGVLEGRQCQDDLSLAFIQRQ